MASPVVVYDASVLRSSPLRSLLLRLARLDELVHTTRRFQAKWTARILDECFDAIRVAHPTADPELLQRMRRRIVEVVPDCLIDGYEPLIQAMELPDPSRQHVLAAAIRAGASTIVTSDLPAFPRELLDPYKIRPLHPDQFISDLLQDIPGPVLAVCHELADDYNNPLLSFEELLLLMERQDLKQAAGDLRSLIRD